MMDRDGCGWNRVLMVAMLLSLASLGSSTALAQCDPPPGGGGGGGGGGGVVFYSLNGQTVQADASGGFLISNVAVVDVFPADNVGDDLLRITAVRVTDQGTEYCYVDEGHLDYPEFGAFRMTPGDTFPFPPGLLTCTPNPPPLPESIALAVGCDPVNPKDPLTCGPVLAAGQRRLVSATATLPGGVQQDVTLPCQWTSYRTSNANIARVMPDHPCPTQTPCDPSDPCRPTGMLVEGVSPGVAFITATNGGATSVAKIIVAHPDDLISTTIEGFVRRPNNTPVALAVVTVRLDDGSANGTAVTSGSSDSTGFFSIGPVALPADPNTGVGLPVFVDASITMGGQTLAGRSSSLTPMAGGITDAGIITIDIVCDTPWSTAFGPTTFDLVNGGPFEGSTEINAFAVFDDGTGPALYAAGLFNRAGGVPANDLARWNGRSWEPVGAGITPGANGSLGAINDMTVADLGDGPALYVVGSFVMAGGQGANKVAKWNGVQWSPVGLGVGDGHSNAYAVSAFDDGSGVALYVGGDFHGAGGVADDGEPITCFPGAPQCVAAPGIARWNGTEWSAVGTGIDTGPVHALAVFDNGSGPELYVGGDFVSSSQVPSKNIVRWDGLVWSAVGGGLTGNNSDRVTSLTVFDDGSGAGVALYAAGNFFGESGGPSANSVARWDGTTWSGLANGINGEVLSVVGLNNGIDPPALFVIGPFSNLSGGGPNTHFIARWDGKSWSGVGTGFEPDGKALAVFDDGSGMALYAGGDACVDCPGFASPRPGSQTDRRKGRGSLGRSSVRDGAASSAFTFLGYVAKWSNSTWSVLSNGLNGEVRALTVFDDDGPGANPPALYAGGRFTPSLGPRDDNAPPFPTSAVARFDGAQWSSLGGGMDCTGLGCVASVHALAAFDEDGAGPNPSRLFAGGAFAFADGVTADNVARWDGTNWSALAGGGADGTIEALAVFDDDATGANPSALYAGGSFSQVGTVTANRVARWDGINWSALGGGMGCTGPNCVASVHALAVFDEDGTGPNPSRLYAGGDFTNAGGVPGTANLARWDGSAWSAVGTGVTGAVHALYVFDADADGPNPPALYAGGAFLTAGGITVNRIARWDGVGWSKLSEGLGPTTAGAVRVDTLLGLDNGAGLFLVAGGDFTSAPTTGGSTVPVNRLAKWNPILDEWSAVGVSSLKGSDPGGGVDTCTGSGCAVRVNALAVFDDGANGPALFAAGAFESAAGAPSSNIAKLGCR